MKRPAIRSAAQAPAAFRFPAHSIAGRVGTSFKHEHLQAILADEKRDRFFEVHAENYMGAGGPPHAALNRIRHDYPVSLHGVCMSIGGPQPLDKTHLGRFNALVDRYEPALVSEHLAWSTHGTAHFNVSTSVRFISPAIPNRQMTRASFCSSTATIVRSPTRCGNSSTPSSPNTQPSRRSSNGTAISRTGLCSKRRLTLRKRSSIAARKISCR